MLLDRFGREVKIGELVHIAAYVDVPIHSNWILIDTIEYPTTVEAILESFINGKIIFVPLQDIEKEI